MSVSVPLVARPTRASATTFVRVFATRWQARGLLIRCALAILGVAHQHVDVRDRPEAARLLIDLGVDDPALLPVVHVDGEWLTRPDPGSLLDALRRHGLL